MPGARLRRNLYDYFDRSTPHALLYGTYIPYGRDCCLRTHCTAGRVFFVAGSCYRSHRLHRISSPSTPVVFSISYRRSGPWHADSRPDCDTTPRLFIPTAAHIYPVSVYRYRRTDFSRVTILRWLPAGGARITALNPHYRSQLAPASATLPRYIQRGSIRYHLYANGFWLRIRLHSLPPAWNLSLPLPPGSRTA